MMRFTYTISFLGVLAQINEAIFNHTLNKMYMHSNQEKALIVLLITLSDQSQNQIKTLNQ